MKKKNVLLWLTCALCALLSVAYGIMIMMLRTGSRFFMIWFVLAIFWLLLPVAVRFGLWRKLPKPVRVVCGSIVTVGLLLFLLIEGVVLGQFGSKGKPQLDYVVVLGAQIYENGPSPVLRYRLDAAAAYLKDNPETICIVTGGQGKNEPKPEAHGMADYLIAKGIEEDRILREDQSKNTTENLRNSVQFLDVTQDEVGIVTSNFHLFRGMGIAKKQGYAHVYGIAAKTDPLYLPNNMLRECAAVIKDFLFGNMAL